MSVLYLESDKSELKNPLVRTGQVYTFTFTFTYPVVWLTVGAPQMTWQPIPPIPLVRFADFLRASLSLKPVRPLCDVVLPSFSLSTHGEQRPEKVVAYDGRRGLRCVTWPTMRDVAYDA